METNERKQLERFGVIPVQSTLVLYSKSVFLKLLDCSLVQQDNTLFRQCLPSILELNCLFLGKKASLAPIHRSSNVLMSDFNTFGIHLCKKAWSPANFPILERVNVFFIMSYQRSLTSLPIYNRFYLI